MKRREFLHQTTATTLLTTVAGSVSISKALAKPNDRINIGVIGVGKQARYLMTVAMRQLKTQVVAVSDVVQERKEDAARLGNDFYTKLEKVLAIYF